MPEYYDPYTDTSWPSTTQPTVNTSSTQEGSGARFDWANFIPQVMKLAPNIISASRGRSYGQAYGPSGQQGQSSGGGGFNVQGGIPFLGGGSLGISSDMLLLLGGAALLIFAMKK